MGNWRLGALACMVALFMLLGGCDWKPDHLTGSQRRWLKKHGPIKVGVFASYPPYSFTDQDGRPMGIGIEIWKAMAKLLDFEVSFQALPLEEQLAMLADGRLDSLAGIFPSALRKKRFDFSMPFFPVNTSVFVNSSEDDHWSWAELRGLKVGVVHGDDAMEICRRQGVRPVLFDDFKAAVLALAQGQVKAVVMDEPVVLYYRNRLGLSDKISWPQFPVVHSSDMALPVNKGNKELLGILNQGLSEVSGSHLGRILDRWRGAKGIL